MIECNNIRLILHLYLICNASLLHYVKACIEINKLKCIFMA